MRPETYDELVEFRARTIRDAQLSMRKRTLFPWSKLTDEAKEPYRHIAESTLEEERDVGIVPVPLEATEEMIQALIDSDPVSGHCGTMLKIKRSVAVREVNAAIAATPYREDGK